MKRCLVVLGLLALVAFAAVGEEGVNSEAPFAVEGISITDLTVLYSIERGIHPHREIVDGDYPGYVTADQEKYGPPYFATQAEIAEARRNEKKALANAIRVANDVESFVRNVPRFLVKKGIDKIADWIDPD